jgi:hypothetical protein
MFIIRIRPAAEGVLTMPHSKSSVMVRMVLAAVGTIMTCGFVMLMVAW